MARQPRVSAILIFLDEERFLEEAIDSIRAQSCPDWELLLVDDGSSDRSPDIARRHAAADPGRIRYLHHPGRVNRGMSASRNAGLAESRGEFVAFLDADDVWLPARLDRGISLLDANPRAAMAYGRTLYWSSWAGGPGEGSDWLQPHGFRAETTIEPPELLRMYLEGRAALPCMGSLTLRRQAAVGCGGFVDEFAGLYEDQAFLARFCLDHAVYVSDEQWDLYRQHPDSACATAARSEEAERARSHYHDWLNHLLDARGLRGTPLGEAAARARQSGNSRWTGRVKRALRQAARRIFLPRKAITRAGGES
jgi:glycosyltransferase involved in cell wall biosynthesis